MGASYGRGAMTCRQGEHFNGNWGAPTMMALEGASFGFQIGAQATDFVLLVMNDHGANSILGDKVKLGADASAAAGPKGTRCLGRDGCNGPRRNSQLFPRTGCFRRRITGRLHGSPGQ